MDKHKVYKLEVFLQDNSFRQWVLSPTPESNLYWTNWLARHPHQLETVNEARAILEALENGMGHLDAEDHHHIKTGLDELLLNLKPDDTSVSKQIWLKPWMKIAAAVVLLAGLSVFWLRDSLRREKTNEASTPWASHSGQTLVQTAQAAQTVFLPDGSIATLEKGSYLRYKAGFNGARRDVYLSGEAFFDVTPSATRPFLVHTRSTTVKVLGTSFRVKAYQEEASVLVAVKSGKVAVQLNPPEREEQKNGRGWVNLVANEQITYNRREVKVTKDWIQDARQISSNLDQKEFVFEDTPVRVVLETLSKHYGITIEFNPAEVSNSRITAEFRDEGLRQKLDAICEAIDARYQLDRNRVILKRIAD